MSLGILIIALPGFGGNQVQGFSVRVSMAFDNPAAQKGSYPLYIFHKPFNIFKDILVHLLQNVRKFLSVFFAGKKKCVVDMSASIRLAACYLSFYGKGVGCF